MADIIGKVIQGYRILEPIEAEPRGYLYKASSSDGKQVVTIRFLPAEVGRNPRLQERLRITSQKLSMLQNPTVLPILASGVSGGYAYLVLPFNSAGSLKDRIENGVLSAINIGEVIGEVASALSDLHRNGVFHGNLNPGDILFDDEGKIHLSGLAEASILRILPSAMYPSANGAEGYQAPEARKGGSTGPPADQYSLGLIALELLTGLPIDEAIRTLKYSRNTNRALSTQPNGITGRLSPQMVAVLTRALSINPADRFPSVEEMNLAFHRAMGIAIPKCEIHSVQTRVNEQPREIGKKKTSASLLVAILCLMVSGAGVFALWKGGLGGALPLPGGPSLTEASKEPQSEWDDRAIVKSTEDYHIEPVESDDQLSLPPTGSTFPPTEEMPIIRSTDSAVGGVTPSSVANGPTSQGTVQETDTPIATSSPEPSLTPTVTPTSTATALSTSTFTPTPTTYVTIAPESCKRNSKHRDYCTPTPTP
jgi:serine/threonine protein kinase